jgi:hypothetical protein
MSWDTDIKAALRARREALLASSNIADTMGLDHPEDRREEQAKLVRVGGVEVFLKPCLTTDDFPTHKPM